jgi:hypothetical protein
MAGRGTELLMRKILYVGCLLFVIALLSLSVPWRTLAVDNAWTAQYYRNQNLQGSPDVVRQDPVITFDWSIAPPLDIFGWPADHFSVRWTKADIFFSGTYVFAARSDDGIRVYVDGVRIIDEWHHRQFEWTSTEITMTQGQHRIVVEFYEDIGRAAIQAGYYPKFSVPTPTPSPTPLKTNTPGPSPTSSGSGGGSSGGSSSGGSGGPTSTHGPTQPSIAGTPGRTPAPISPPPVVGGIVIQQDNPKMFTWAGFPGPAEAVGGNRGSYAYAKNQSLKPTLQVQWSFRPRQSGFYDVYVFIPQSPRSTGSATYRVYHGETLSGPIVVDQSTFDDQWLLIGTYYFAATELQFVTVNNATGEPSATREVLFDDIMFVYKP